jgi:F-type H+-transporting ATPase subunit delta
MQQRISRRKLAVYIVDQLDRGANLEIALRELAAYLIDTKRTREADLVARSIEDELAGRGTAIAHVASARPLGNDIKQALQRLLNASTIHLTEEVDPSLIGGIRIEAPGKRLDATVKRKILALDQVKM